MCVCARTAKRTIKFIINNHGLHSCKSAEIRSDTSSVLLEKSNQKSSASFLFISSSSSICPRRRICLVCDVSLFALGFYCAVCMFKKNHLTITYDFAGTHIIIERAVMKRPGPTECCGRSCL